MVNDVFGALAHPLRRGIIERLAHGPATVGVATRELGVSKPAITRHLKILEDCGVGVRTVEGRRHRLGLNAVALRDSAAWVDRQRAAWERLFDAVEERLGTEPGARS